MDKLREVPIKAKIWLKEYETGGILIEADCDNNRFVLEIPGVFEKKTERWVMKYDADKNSFVKIE